MVVLVSDIGEAGVSNAWPETSFINVLVKEGCTVVRYNLRDSGRATCDEEHPRLSLVTRHLSCLSTQLAQPPYTLSTLARDLAELCRRLTIVACHVVGAGQGGAVARFVALEHPALCISVTTVNSPHDSFLKRSECAVSTRAVPKDKFRPASNAPLLVQARYLADQQRVWRTPAATYNAATLTELCYQRLSFIPRTTACPLSVCHKRYRRQAWCARHLEGKKNRERLEALTQCKKPMLMVQGTQDPFVSVQSAVAAASAVPSADLLLLVGVAHDLPDSHAPAVAQAVLRLMSRDQSSSGGDVLAADPLPQCSSALFYPCSDDSFSATIKSRVPQRYS